MSLISLLLRIVFLFMVSGSSILKGLEPILTRKPSDSRSGKTKEPSTMVFRTIFLREYGIHVFSSRVL